MFLYLLGQFARPFVISWFLYICLSLTVSYFFVCYVFPDFVRASFFSHLFSMLLLLLFRYLYHSLFMSVFVYVVRYLFTSLCLYSFIVCRPFFLS